jgi:putative addiction module component (TIGR02574 family)
MKESLMTKEQKAELDKRAQLYREGKLKTYSWKEVKAKARAAK